jgi:hypothetical protein
MASMVVAICAMLVFGLGGTAAGKKKKLKLKTTTVDAVSAVNFTTVAASTPGLGNTQDNNEYDVLTATATCPGGTTAIAGNAFFSIPNSNAGTLDGDELLLAGVQKVGNGYSAEGLSDLNNNTIQHNFTVQVTCAATTLVKPLATVKPKGK